MPSANVCALNVDAVTVSGTLTVNGVAPVLKTTAVNGYDCVDYSNRVAVLTFRNLSSNATTSTLVPCAIPASWSISLVAGNYEVRVENGGGANVPGPATVLESALTVAATMTRTFNINSVALNGNLTVNGAPPVLKTTAVNGYNCVDYSKRVAVLTFKNAASGSTTSATVPCANPATYSVLLVAGTYEVRIANGGGANVPGPDSILNPALTVSTTGTQNFDINAVGLSGSLTVNGAPPVLKTTAVNGYNCVDYSNRVAQLTFKNTASGATTSATVACANPATYSVALVAGTYEVRVENGGGANVPNPATVVNSSLVVSATGTQNFNLNAVTLSGSLTVNGAPPVLKTTAVSGYNCVDYSNRVALLVFKNVAGNVTTSATVPCATPASYSIALVAGTYEVRIQNGGGANVPGPESVLNPAFVVSATGTQNFDVDAVTLTGSLTVNGAVPVLKTTAVNGYNCVDYSNRVALMSFKNTTSNASTSVTVQCATPAVFSVQLVAGTYEVRVENGRGANVPGPSSVLNSSLVVSAPMTQAFNINSVSITGTLTVNGAPPVLKTTAVNGHNCVDYSNRVALLTFKNLGSNTSSTATVACATPATFSATLVPGVYEVQVASGGGANVPGPDSILYSAVQF